MATVENHVKHVACVLQAGLAVTPNLPQFYPRWTGDDPSSLYNFSLFQPQVTTLPERIEKAHEPACYASSAWGMPCERVMRDAQMDTWPARPAKQVSQYHRHRGGLFKDFLNIRAYGKQTGHPPFLSLLLHMLTFRVPAIAECCRTGAGEEGGGGGGGALASNFEMHQIYLVVYAGHAELTFCMIGAAGGAQ